jgi:TRAP-type C4-dicarboxylate transport system permease small subunit
MPTKSISLYCPTCDAAMPHVKETPNHVLHAILTLLFVGAWGVVWLVVVLRDNAKPACSKCGRVEETPAYVEPPMTKTTKIVLAATGLAIFGLVIYAVITQVGG